MMSTDEEKNGPSPVSLEVAQGSDDKDEMEQAASDEAKKTQPTRKSVWKQVAAVVVLCLIVFAVVFPLTYKNDDDDDDDVDSIVGKDPGGITQNGGAGSSDGNTGTVPTPTDPVTPPQPPTSPTKSPTRAPTPPDESSNNPVTPPRPPTSPTKSPTRAPTPPDESSSNNNEEFVVSSKDAPFPVRLSVLDPQVARGYNTKDELREDLKNVARFLLNNVVFRNTGKPGYGGLGIGRPNPNGIFLARPVFADAPDAAFAGALPVSAPASPPAPTSAERAPAASDAGGVANDFDDYGTNNQEEGVEEGDQLVSDGENVYAAYGDTVVVWNADTGKKQLELKMPKEIIQDAPTAPKDDTGDDGSEPAETTTTTSRSFFYPPYYSDPKPVVRHLLLHEDRLLVVVDASAHHYTYGASTLRKLPVFYNYLSTHVRLYKIVKKEPQQSNNDGTTTLGGVDLELVSTADLHGRFHAVRSVNGKAHVVTNSGIDTYSDLIEPFDFYKFRHLSKDDYVQEIQRIAEDEAIPKFVDGIMTELQAGPAFPNLFRISLMQSSTSGEEKLEDFAFGQGVINSLTQVHSFDMTSDKRAMEFTVSGAFLPTYVSHVYGAENALVIVGEGWEHHPRLASGQRQPSTQMSHLLGIAINNEDNNAVSYPHAIGKVPGYVLNSHSVDVQENILRVATTVRNTWWWFGPPVPIPVEPVLEPGEDLADEERGDNVDSAGDEPVTIIAPPPPPPRPESSTQNYVTTLNMTTSSRGGVMKQLGRIQLGKPNEVFTAVRFFDNIAYAVTFERTDPLYALNLTDPANPWKISELNVTGFSSYLHSINDDNTLILAIGEEADNNGRVLGLMITIFDMRDPTKPRVAQRHIIEKDPSTYSSSASLWDFLAVRYAAGRLIIPMDINSWQNKTLNFHGFAVFIANENEITESCRISQDSPNDGGRFYCYHRGNALPKRSMIFRGDLMTTDRHHIAMTDLDTCEERWSFDIFNADPNTCFGGGMPIRPIGPMPPVDPVPFDPDPDTDADGETEPQPGDVPPSGFPDGFVGKPSGGGEEDPTNSTRHGPKEAEINCPNVKWKRVQGSAFSFSVPVDFVEKDVQGIDSEVGAWTGGNEVDVSYDYGWYSGSISGTPGAVNEPLDYSGIAGELTVVNVKGEPENQVGVLFPEIVQDGPQWTGLGMLVSFPDPADENLARCIVSSITFDNQPQPIPVEPDGGIGDGAGSPPIEGEEETDDIGLTEHGPEVAETSCPSIEWQRVQGSAFSFSVPADFAEKEVQGIDSEVGAWTGGNEVEVSFDYGWYSGTISGTPGAVNEPVNYSGIVGELTVVLDEDENRVGILFPEIAQNGPQWIGLGMLVRFPDSDDEAVARCIVSSITFDDE